MKSKPLLLLLSVALFCAAQLSRYLFIDTPSAVISGFERQLHKKELLLNEEIIKLQERAKTEGYNSLFAKKSVYYNNLFEKEGLVLLIYENDSLKYWTDNSVAVENWRKEVCLDTRMVKLQNGWFEVLKPVSTPNAQSIIGLILIKNEFTYQNKYLVNSFQKDFGVPAGVKLIPNAPEAGYPIKDKDNNYLFSLQLGNFANPNNSSSYLALVLNLLGLVLFVFFIRKTTYSLRPRIGINTEIILFSVTVIFLRYLSIKFLFPKNFYEFELFNPKIYADASSVWLSSLGDLLINTSLFFLIGFIIVREFEMKGVWLRLNNYNKLLFSTLLFFIYLVGWRIVSFVIIGLIRHSNISFSINYVFGLNQYSYIALVIVALLLLMSFLVADKLMHLFMENKLSRNQYLLILLISVIGYALSTLVFENLEYANVFMPLLLLVVIGLMKQENPTYSFTKIVVLVFLFSFYVEYIFDKYSDKKEMESRKIFAERVAAEQDPVAEFLFNDIDNKLQDDSTLISYIGGTKEQLTDFEKRLRDMYFGGFWEKYDVKISFFDSLCTPVLKPQNLLYDNNLYFDELISKKSAPTADKHLYFLKNASGKVSYLAKIPLFDFIHPTSKLGTLYIELDAKLNSNEIGFPELLLDKKLGSSDEFDGYSYAKYKKNKLVHQYGKFLYNSSNMDFLKSGKDFDTMDKDDYNHLLFSPDPDTMIVVSKREYGLYGHITTFSYLFTFFSLLLLVLFFSSQLVTGTLLENLSFKYRIQLLLVSIVLISLILFGGGTVYFIKQQFKTENKENISEKTHSVLVDVGNKLGNENNLHELLSEYSTFSLQKSSNIFFTDINLYDTKGNLFASSRQKIFDKGLISRKMNPEAYLHMSVLGKREYIHDEKIGKLEYLSAYIPFKNKDDKLLGYLNLPYFAKQNDLEKEISAFLVALINIYVLLFVLSVVMTLIISNYVTQPLKLIQDKLSKIKLGKFNEPIEWREKDEIGSLVSEYNRMIAELTKSAELLAKSERESAWREMAKQVAHEIKNPLTPMKLNIQHLRRLQNDRSVDMEQKINELTQTLIEQIDALSNIATEFSNFAKMPKANLEKVNVCDVLSNSITLFKDSENIQFEFNDMASPEAFVLADKEQLLRVFNNLIKNSVQAIPQGRVGKIEVGLKQEDQWYIISVKDDGIGISAENTDKIFVPNFTSKTGGTGLGLAMVKNIVESIGGKIRFESKVNEGATFYVTLPCYLDSEAK